MTTATDRTSILMIAASFVLVFGIVAGVYATKSYFEAAAFNRITGKNVSTWDAMFLELRVQEDARP
jgi:hypothetical protein